MRCNRTHIIFASLIVLLLGSTKIAAESHAQGQAKARLALTKIKEIREKILVKSDEQSFSMDKPGLALSYEVVLPEGRQLLEITQPEPSEVKASDSDGNDISKVEPNFMDKREYVSLIQMYGESPKNFTFHLALPSRRASSFDLNVDLQAVTFTGSKTVDVAVTKDWTDLDGKLFGVKKVQMRIEKSAQGLQLTVKPGTVKATIEDVQLFNGSAELEESFSMWNAASISYMFNGEAADSMTAKLTVRTGLSQEKLVIALDDQPLP